MAEYTVTRLYHPSRVRLQLQGPGTAEYEFPPLQAAHLAGALTTHALELVNEDEKLGTHRKQFGPVIVWTYDETLGWVPHRVARLDRLNALLHELRESGTWYSVMVEIIGHPLAPPAEGGPL